MGKETQAYKGVIFDEWEGFDFEEDYDSLTGKSFKFPNGELQSIAEKFKKLSNGDIDFDDYIMFETPFLYCADPDRSDYLNASKEFYDELINYDFTSVEETLEKALKFYDENESSFKPDIFWKYTDREVLEYLIMLVKEKYYITWTN